MLTDRGCQKKNIYIKNVEKLGRDFNVCGLTKGTDKLFCFNSSALVQVSYSKSNKMGHLVV